MTRRFFQMLLYLMPTLAGIAAAQDHMWREMIACACTAAQFGLVSWFA
jgi:hypothetical protein